MIRLLPFLLAGCTLVVTSPQGQIRSLMVGNGHVTVCRPGGVTVRQRSASADPEDPQTPVGAEVADVSIHGDCVEVSGGATSSNLVIAIGLIVAAAATVAAVLA